MNPLTIAAVAIGLAITALLVWAFRLGAPPPTARPGWSWVDNDVVRLPASARDHLSTARALQAAAAGMPEVSRATARDSHDPTRPTLHPAVGHITVYLYLRPYVPHVAAYGIEARLQALVTPPHLRVHVVIRPGTGYVA